MAVESEPDEIAPRVRQVAVEDALLRDVTHAFAVLARRPAVTRTRPGRRFEQAEQDADERCLAGAVRTEDGEELAAARARSRGAPRAALAEAEREALAESTTLIAPARVRELPRLPTLPLLEGRCDGSVSVTPMTGIVRLRRGVTHREVIGETAWLL